MDHFLAIGDFHIKSKSMEEVNCCIDKILTILEEVSPVKFVVLLGDILNNHERVSISELIASHRLLTSLSEKNKVYLLIGNHDRPKNTCYMTEEHAFNPYKSMKNIVVVDKTFSDEIEMNGKKEKFLFVPYVPPGKFMDAVFTSTNIEELKKFKCIFAHQEFKGVSFGRTISKKGDLWDESFPKIINGHIHNYSILGNIHCVGAIRQVAFDETPDKTVSLFDSELAERRIDCMVTKKISIALQKADLTSFNFDTLDKKNQYKISVEAGKSDVSHIMSLVKMSNVTLVFKNENANISSSGRKTYLECLKTLLDENIEERGIFSELFGEIK